jgi:SIR2-like domain
LSLAEYYYLTQGAIGPLRSWMDTTWHNSEVDISKSSIHKAVVRLDFPIIYTTNYDRWLEKAFEHHKANYIKISSVADIARAKEGITQIVKLHGDFDDDDSIVLTESDYFERINFESPLDIKLRSDVLGKTILFLGYSLSDLNMRYLFYKLQKQWQATKFEKIRPKLYIYLTKPNIVQEKILNSRGIEPIVSEVDDPKKGLSDFLSKLLHEAFGQAN